LGAALLACLKLENRQFSKTACRPVTQPPGAGFLSLKGVKNNMQTLTDMLSRLNRRSRRFLAISLAACVLCVIAYAAIPDTAGVIHGCYKRNNGTLRVIDDAVTQCDNSETPIQWSQTARKAYPVRRVRRHHPAFSPSQPRPVRLGYYRVA
jgi:hypothetical protein